MKQGFTLMEAIVAITVITVGIVGVLSLVSQTISSSTFSKDKLVAAYLAQEGIEIVRNIRDTNWVEGVASSWYEGLTGCASGYEADYDDTDLSCWSDPGRFLELQSGGFYSYDSGTQPKFKRKITIVLVGTNELKVSVEIQWQEKGQNYPLTVQENLYDW